MPDYEKMYIQLAASVADAVEILVKAQLRGEEDYCAEPPPPLELVPKDDNE